MPSESRAAIELAHVAGTARRPVSVGDPDDSRRRHACCRPDAARGRSAATLRLGRAAVASPGDAARSPRDVARRDRRGRRTVFAAVRTMASKTGWVGRPSCRSRAALRPSPSAAPAPPGLVEEARVLDRDHRLVGEGLKQRDCLSVKQPGPRRRPRSRRWPASRSIGTASELR